MTIPAGYDNIFKQSAQHGFLPQKTGIATIEQVCEGGGTGRRARLRCVWFILGGSSPLPRTSLKVTKYRLKFDTSWLFCFVRRLDDAGYCRGFACFCEKKVCKKSAGKPRQNAFMIRLLRAQIMQKTPPKAQNLRGCFSMLYSVLPPTDCSRSVSADAALAARERSIQRVILGSLSSGALPEFRIATNCCSCLRELTPSLS